MQEGRSRGRCRGARGFPAPMGHTRCRAHLLSRCRFGKDSSAPANPALCTLPPDGDTAEVDEAAGPAPAAAASGERTTVSAASADPGPCSLPSFRRKLVSIAATATRLYQNVARGLQEQTGAALRCPGWVGWLASQRPDRLDLRCVYLLFLGQVMFPQPGLGQGAWLCYLRMPRFPTTLPVRAARAAAPPCLRVAQALSPRPAPRRPQGFHRPPRACPLRPRAFRRLLLPPGPRRGRLRPCARGSASSQQGCAIA